LLARFPLAVLVVALVSLGCQPKDETPGLWLRGESVAQQADGWGCTDGIEEVFIETRPWYGIPHSTTIWCVELEGELYIGSYGDEKKAWEKNVARNPQAKLAIAGKLHEVTVAPVAERRQIEVLDGAYTQKYDMAAVFGDELPEWWYYHVARR
jgi:hypothetical protein